MLYTQYINDKKKRMDIFRIMVVMLVNCMQTVYLALESLQFSPQPSVKKRHPG